MVIGPGCLCFSLVLRTNRAPGLTHIQPAARYVMDRVVEDHVHRRLEGVLDR